MINTLQKLKEVQFKGIYYRLMGDGRYYLSQSRTNEGLIVN